MQESERRYIKPMRLQLHDSSPGREQAMHRVEDRRSGLESGWPGFKTRWADHYIRVANRTLWPASTHEAILHHGLCTLRLQRSGTDGPPHPPGLSHLAETETPVMAAGWVKNQQAVGNGGRPAAPPNSWQHVDWGSKLGWSTVEEENEEEEEDRGGFESGGPWFKTWFPMLLFPGCSRFPDL